MFFVLLLFIVFCLYIYYFFLFFIFFFSGRIRLTSCALVTGVQTCALPIFREQVGWPVDLALFDRDAMIVSQAAQERGSVLFVRRRPGFRIPVLTTALGRAYLAFCDQAEQAAVIGRLAKMPRSEERREGKECVSTCRSRGSREH